MNLFQVRSAGVARVRRALKRPFVTALGSKTETENVRVRVRLAGGAEGWGEASSSVVQAHLKPARIEACLRRLAAGAVGQDVRRWRALARSAFSRCGEVTPAASALESALLDALTRQLGLPLWRFFGGATDTIETDVTLSAWPAAQAATAARDAAKEGFRTLKIKVGTGAGPDWERVRAAAEIRPKPRVILDGNQKMTASGALALVERCLSAGIAVELLEQPLRRDDLGGMRRLTRRCPVPVAADESARSPEEALAVLSSGAANAVNVKAAKTGFAASLDVIAVARAHGAPLMIGCMQETSLGLSASVHLACGTGAFRWADLDSDVLLAEPKPEGRYVRRGPRVTAAS
ncbi:MAG: dipeptide epimerase [Elusimicrobia bacterium]|nr:dipeptide epimerase [Elusimicrobiota bacterium]